jgi:hypothetical protein
MSCSKRCNGSTGQIAHVGRGHSHQAHLRLRRRHFTAEALPDTAPNPPTRPAAKSAPIQYATTSTGRLSPAEWRRHKSAAKITPIVAVLAARPCQKASFALRRRNPAIAPPRKNPIPIKILGISHKKPPWSINGTRCHVSSRQNVGPTIAIDTRIPKPVSCRRRTCRQARSAKSSLLTATFFPPRTTLESHSSRPEFAGSKSIRWGHPPHGTTKTAMHPTRRVSSKPPLSAVPLS